MAFDAGRGVTILFGGSALLDQFADTWRWDGKGWTQLHPAHSPVALSGHLMAYDEARHQVVLFGGAHGLYEKAQFRTDTWTWDGTDWTLQPGTGPQSLEGQSMAFDPKSGTVILFGGSFGNLSYSNETWAWDGLRWTRIQTQHRPAPRNGAALSSDRARGGVLLFGGASLKPDAGPGEAGVPLGDTWSLAGGDWTELKPATSPTARANAVLAPDPDGARLILFSGGSCPFGSETWAWSGSTWTLLHPATAPQARTYAAASAGSRQALLFGGLADRPCL